MKINPEEIVKEKHRPVNLFYQGIKSESTKYDYTNKLKKVVCEFLQLVLKGNPELVMKQKLEIKKTPGKHRTFNDADFEQRANELVNKAKGDQDWAQSVLLKLSEKLRERSELPKTDEEYLNPITIQNYFKPIQKLFDMNGVTVSWKRIKSTFPELEKSDSNGEYNHADIQRMLEHCRVDDMVIILICASSGIRAGAFDFRWKHVRPIYKHEDKILWADEDVTESVSKNGIVIAGMIQIYTGSNSEYISFFTPECWNAIQSYRRLWIKDIGREPKPDDPFFKKAGELVIKLGDSGIRKRVERILIESGLRVPLAKGQRRHEIPALNGFRRFFNKQNKKSLSKNSILASLILKEYQMGHTGLIKLDQNYFREHVEELIDEYLGAVPNLTISNEERLLADNNKKQKEITELEKLKETVESQSKNNREMREELKEVKTGLQVFSTMMEITQNSAVIDNRLAQETRKQTLKIFGKEEIREQIDKDIKEVQNSGITEEQFAKILKKYVKDSNEF